jgi:hypothetical protein
MSGAEEAPWEAAFRGVAHDKYMFEGSEAIYANKAALELWEATRNTRQNMSRKIWCIASRLAYVSPPPPPGLELTPFHLVLVVTRRGLSNTST